MGEPEAGSEFAIRAAAAGEARRPGFGVTMRRPRGTERVWTEHKIILFLSSIQYPFHIHCGPCAKEPSGQQRVNPRRRWGVVSAIGAEHPEWWGSEGGMDNALDWEILVPNGAVRVR